MVLKNRFDKGLEVILTESSSKAKIFPDTCLFSVSAGKGNTSFREALIYRDVEALSEIGDYFRDFRKFISDDKIYVVASVKVELDNGVKLFRKFLNDMVKSCNFNEFREAKYAVDMFGDCVSKVKELGVRKCVPGMKRDAVRKFVKDIRDDLRDSGYDKPSLQDIVQVFFGFNYANNFHKPTYTVTADGDLMDVAAFLRRSDDSCYGQFKEADLNYTVCRLGMNRDVMEVFPFYF